MILVVGGGIAGTAAALAIAQAGFEVSVFEAHPSDGADIGAFLTLADNGVTALRQLGVDTSFGFELTSMAVVDHTGAELAVVPLNGYRCVRRAVLGEVLREEVRRRGIPLRQGAHFSGFTGDGIRFADGSTAAGSLVIGADGLNSTVRPFVDPACAGPRYAGQWVYYGYGSTPGPPERITMIRGTKSAFGYCRAPDGETFWFARVADSLASLDSQAAAIAASGESMVTKAWDLVPGGRWFDGRALLIGDAAHAASPATGQGASMALEDAVVLGKALRDCGDQAMEVYERLRRDRVERNIEVSAAATNGARKAGSPQGRVSRVDEQIAETLDWNKKPT
ncbi:MAG TPA: FAD-dependent monooxygenase [Pseudonocardiaceae bacterium]|jgi:2-polyprenyl-6-methoxyphenol hydroxylase-like FAD-dependent oxidoreductase|nr:FAD-dependent monooxygenase [Pseudonocardiaceae bacterium]